QHIVYQRLVYKRYGQCMRHTFYTNMCEGMVGLRFEALYIHLVLRRLSPKITALIQKTRHDGVGWCNDRVCIFKKLPLLCKFLIFGVKAISMGCSERGQDTDSRTDHLGQTFHFARSTYPGLNQGYLMLLLDFPQSQGNAQLRIVAFGTLIASPIDRQQLVKPFLDNGFAIASRDTYHRNHKLLSMESSQLLKGNQRIFYPYKIGPYIRIGIQSPIGHHKVSHTFTISIFDK